MINDIQEMIVTVYYPFAWIAGIATFAIIISISLLAGFVRWFNRSEP